MWKFDCRSYQVVIVLVRYLQGVEVLTQVLNRVRIGGWKHSWGDWAIDTEFGNV